MFRVNRRRAEDEFIKACLNIMWHGSSVTDDRTGVGTKMLTNVVIEHSDVEQSFPMLLSKRVAWKPVVGELLWFIEGSTDVYRLAEITYGDPDHKTIWTENYTDHLVRMFGHGEAPQQQGDLGPIYGHQWRHWDGGFNKPDIDQLAEVVEAIKEDPSSRRHVVSAWNPSDLDQMALPPCHWGFQFNVVDKRYLDILVTMRSGDMFLGVPFNIASYALLLKLVARETNLVARKLTLVIGNAHIYNNHFDQVWQMVNNYQNKVSGWDLGDPTVTINTEHSMFSVGLTVDDIVLENYSPIETIKAPMAV